MGMKTTTLASSLVWVEKCVRNASYGSWWHEVGDERSIYDRSGEGRVEERGRSVRISNLRDLAEWVPHRSSFRSFREASNLKFFRPQDDLLLFESVACFWFQVLLHCYPILMSSPAIPNLKTWHSPACHSWSWKPIPWGKAQWFHHVDWRIIR